MSALIGICGILFGIGFTFTHKHEGFSGYFDISGFILVGVLPPSIMLLSHTIADFFVGIRVLFSSIFNQTNRQRSRVIDGLSTVSAKVRLHGVGALVAERNRLSYDLLIDGVSLIVNNFTSDEIKHNLQAKINARQQEMALATNLFENMSKVSPGVGMIGTLLGLIAMLSKLSEPAAIGSGMALALITTLYGLLLGTIIYAPFSEKIAIEAEKIHKLDMLVLDGVLALKGKKSSIHFRDIIKTYGAGSSQGTPRKPSPTT